MNTKEIRVFIAHRDAMTLDLLVNALSGEFTIAGSSSSTTDLLEKLRGNQCDVALISNIPQGAPKHGYGILQQLRDQSPQTRIVLLLDQCERDAVIAAFRSGAKGVFCSRSEERRVGEECR